MTEDAVETPLQVLNALATWVVVFAEAADLDHEETSVNFTVRNRVTGVEREIGVTLAQILARAQKVVEANA